MRTKTVAITGLIGLFLLAVTVILFLFVFAHPSNHPVKAHPYSRYSINAYGETYGSLADAATFGEEPDLIRAMGMDGKTIGYIRNSEMSLPEPKTRLEIFVQKILYSNGRRISLYEADGRTKIGEYQIDGPGVASTTITMPAATPTP